MVANASRLYEDRVKSCLLWYGHSIAVGLLEEGKPAGKESLVKRRITLAGVLLMLFFSCADCPAARVMGDGEIDDTELRYEGFHIGEDGSTIGGYIINGSKTAYRNVTLHMYTTNPQETRVFWRKTIKLGDIGPGEKRHVKETYGLRADPDARIKVMIKLPPKARLSTGQ